MLTCHVTGREMSSPMLPFVTLTSGYAILLNVVVVMTSPSGTAYMGGQMSRRDEEFHQTLIILEHICGVNRITKVTLAFCCPFWAEQ